MTTKILLLESKRNDHVSFGPALVKKGYQVQSVPNGSAAQALLEDYDPDLVVVDAASLRTSARRICHSLHQQVEGLAIILIVSEQQLPSGKVEADVILKLPFTVQKLANRVKLLMPGDEKDLLHVGPIRLNLKQKQVRCMGRHARLTPRQVILLKALMDRPGEVIEREALFRLVWDTEYTGDTRTLDVHISWLRHALEANPRSPRFLKTIRGVGYRLDI